MAWPCISRVCCLARFWNQLDKSDLSVPLTIHNYSDIEEPSEDAGEAAAEQHRQQQQQRIPTGGGGGGSSRAPPALPASASAPSLQDPGQPHSRKGGRRHLQPFSAETQYRQDYRAWPLQKRHVLPWIRHGTADGSAPRTAHVYVLPADGHGHGQVGGREGALPQSQEWASRSPPGLPRTSSYRHEYRPWTAAKRSRPTKTKQGFIIPEDHFGQESSYKADFKIPEAKAKFSPNPSAVFQAPTRILNV